MFRLVSLKCCLLDSKSLCFFLCQYFLCPFCKIKGFLILLCNIVSRSSLVISFLINEKQESITQQRPCLDRDQLECFDTQSKASCNSHFVFDFSEVALQVRSLKNNVSSICRLTVLSFPMTLLFFIVYSSSVTLHFALIAFAGNAQKLFGRLG